MKIDSSYGTPGGAPTRATWPIGVAVTVLATGVLAWDHLWGNEPGTDDPFPVDPSVFALGTGEPHVRGRSVLVAVPRTRRKPNTGPRRAMWLAGTAIALAPIATWLGVPLILAGGGIALGQLAPQRRSAADGQQPPSRWARSPWHSDSSPPHFHHIEPRTPGPFEPRN